MKLTEKYIKITTPKTTYICTNHSHLSTKMSFKENSLFGGGLTEHYPRP